MFQIKIESKIFSGLISIAEKIGSVSVLVLRPDRIVLSVTTNNNASMWVSALLSDLGLVKMTEEAVYFEINIKTLSKVFDCIYGNNNEILLVVYDNEVIIKGEKTTDNGHTISFEHKIEIRKLLQNEKALLREPELSIPEINVFIETFHEMLSFVSKIEKISNVVKLSFLKRENSITLVLEGSYQTINPKVSFNGLKLCGFESATDCTVVIKAKTLLNVLQCNILIPSKIVFSSTNRKFLVVYVHFAEEGTLSYFIPSIIESI